MCTARLDTFLLGLAAILPVALIGFVVYSSIPAPRSSSGTQGRIDESVNGEVPQWISSVSYADAPGEDVRFSEHEGISATEMRRIGELKVVRSLRMPINATDEDLRLIRGLRVWSFSVLYSQVRGPGLVNLSEVEGLEDLGLGWAKIDDDGLAYLPQLTNLRSLHLAGRGITELGIKLLCEKGFDNLEMLDVSNTSIGDGAIKLIAAHFKRLQWLNVYHTQVSDGALIDLETIRALRFLGCGLSRITPDGVRCLRAWRPNIDIDNGG